MYNVQYTHRRPTRLNKLFNQMVIELLTLQIFTTSTPKTNNTFDWLYDQNTLGNSFEEAINELSQIDEKLWC